MNTLGLFASIFLLTFTSLHYKVAAKPPLRIFNGTTAEEGEFPYMVQIRTPSTYLCGGSIIGPEWILTAGHCVYEKIEIDSIVYGTTKLYEEESVPRNNTIKVKTRFQHPKYTYITEFYIPIYDVGILQLQEPITFSETAQPIKMAEGNAKVPFHVSGNLSGWGAIDKIYTPPAYLQKLSLQFLTDEECTKNINGNETLTAFYPEHNLCTDDNNNGEANGDSGSPFVISGIQYGISSWGMKPGYVPGAFTRISNPEYRDWIKNVTGI